MYFWTLLHKSEKEFVKKVFDTQKEFSSKNDWVILVHKDMKELNIDLSEEKVNLKKLHKKN